MGVYLSKSCPSSISHATNIMRISSDVSIQLYVHVLYISKYRFEKWAIGVIWQDPSVSNTPPGTCWHLPGFLYEIEECSVNSSKWRGNSSEALNLNRLFDKKIIYIYIYMCLYSRFYRSNFWFCTTTVIYLVYFILYHYRHSLGVLYFVRWYLSRVQCSFSSTPWL
jgi:hypothetical protein